MSPVEVLPCRVGGERIALPLDRVREVAPIARLAALPEAPPWVLGLLDLRGAAVPVVDLGARLRRAAREPELSDLILVVERGGRPLGLVVDAVEPVRGLDPAAVEPPPSGLGVARYLTGVAVDGEAGPLLLLDLDVLLAGSELGETP